MSDYHRSQDLVARAEASLASGDPETASRLLREAGRIQRRLVEQLPSARVRTRSVFGVSAASLLFGGGDLDAAEALALCLIRGELEPHSRQQLGDLLARIQDERGATDDAGG
jgi:hypothetical protein